MAQQEMCERRPSYFIANPKHSLKISRGRVFFATVGADCINSIEHGMFIQSIYLQMRTHLAERGLSPRRAEAALGAII